MRPELETVRGDILRKELCQDHSTMAGCSGAGVSSHCKTKPRDRCDSAWTSLSPAQVLAGKGQYLGRQCHTWGHRSHEQGGTKTAPRIVPCPSHRECPVQREWPRPPAHHGHARHGCHQDTPIFPSRSQGSWRFFQVWLWKSTVQGSTSHLAAV